jgi:hypothetical protein
LLGRVGLEVDVDEGVDGDVADVGGLDVATVAEGTDADDVAVVLAY